MEAANPMQGVVVAVRREDGRYLCIRRSYQLPRAPGKVCFPGGQIEAGETQPAAVKREMKEELGIDVEPVRQCWKGELNELSLVLWGWIANWVGGELAPEPKEIAEIFWFTADEISEHSDGLPATREFVKCLQK